MEPRRSYERWPTTERLSALDSEEISRFRALTSVEELLATVGDGIGLEWRGQQHGWWREFRDGALIREGWLRDGSRIGNWTEYHEGGAVRTRGGHAGSKVGLHVTWDEDGQVDYEASGFMVRGELCVPRGHVDHERGRLDPIVIDHGGKDPRYRRVWRSVTCAYSAPVNVPLLYPRKDREGFMTPPGLDPGLPIYLAAAAADPEVRKWWREVVDAEIDHRGWDPSPRDR